MRGALVTHLEGLRVRASEHGFVHLETALDGALRTLLEDDFDVHSVLAVRVLAQRYDELAAMPSRSGAHPVVRVVEPEGDTVRSFVDDVTDEIRRGLLEAARNGGGDAPLQEGRRHEVLTPVWKAISELRAIIEERSSGGVRFDDEGGVPLLTLSGVEGAVDPTLSVSLTGRRVLVADDDAEVRWFYVGVLREAGARVVEASDGRQALAQALEDPPDLILADIVMPRLDGLGLCAAVRRQPMLDGVPVILLSWRDDFLHRMRELRADAHDYLRKELPAQQLLIRIAEVLAPLRRVEEALATGEEARGDLEELGVATLFRAIRRHRPDTVLALQDPWSLFEVAFSEGILVGATQTTIDGQVRDGESVLLPLAGMDTGRFVVTAAPEPMTGDRSLDADFRSIGARLGRLITAVTEHPEARLEFDPKILDGYLRHSPVGIRDIVARLAAGESPDALLKSGLGSRAVLDALLTTLARRGAVLTVEVPEPPSLVEEEPMEVGHTAMDPETTAEEPNPWAARENFRAQSSVSMHRQPVNRVARPTEGIWRRPATAGTEPEPEPSFVPQSTMIPRLFALGFIAVLLSTAVFLLWQGERAPRTTPSDFARSATAPPPEPATRPRPPTRPAIVEASPDLPLGLAGYVGQVVPGIDPTLEPTTKEGALELLGPAAVRVHVDGVDRGTLPLTLVLPEGRHLVRFGSGGSWTYRMYYVERGTTRTLRVARRPGGFVDAR